MSVESEYYAGTIAVMMHELDVIMDSVKDIMLRLEELEHSLDMSEHQKEDERLRDEYNAGYEDGRDDENDWQLFWDDEPIHETGRKFVCHCPACEDSSYRMD